MVTESGLERTCIGYAVIDSSVRPIYSDKSTVELAWMSHKSQHIYELAGQLSSTTRNPFKRFFYKCIQSSEEQHISDEPSPHTYQFRGKKLTFIKDAVEQRSSGYFKHTLRLAVEEASIPVELSTGDTISGIVWERSVDGWSPRTCFVPHEFHVNDAVYAGYEIKGYRPLSRIDYVPLGRDQPLRVLGGMTLEDALRAYDRSDLARKSGRTDPIPLEAASLPFTASDIQRAFVSKYLDKFPNKPTPEEREKILEEINDPHFHKQMGIYVRARQTNLDLGIVEHLFEDITRDLEFTPQEYFDFFLTNFLKDLFNLRKMGLMPTDIHERNISILGAIKDEDEYSKGKRLQGEEIPTTLALGVAGYSLQHIRMLGRLCDIEEPETVLFERFSEIFGKKVTSPVEMYQHYKDFS